MYVESGCSLDIGQGMIDEDPLFADIDRDYFYLKQDPIQPGISNSCVDGGDPSSLVIEGSTRIDGEQDTGVVDMGFHYQVDNTLTVPDTYATI